MEPTQRSTAPGRLLAAFVVLTFLGVFGQRELMQASESSPRQEPPPVAEPVNSPPISAPDERPSAIDLLGPNSPPADEPSQAIDSLGPNSPPADEPPSLIDEFEVNDPIQERPPSDGPVIRIDHSPKPWNRWTIGFSLLGAFCILTTITFAILRPR